MIRSLPDQRGANAGLKFAGALLIAAMLLPACAVRNADCKQPAVFCVGLVTNTGGLSDHGSNQAAWEGIQQAKHNGVATWIASIETVDSRDYQENIRVFGEAGYDVIVTVGSAMGDATRAEAAEYPNAYFIGVDQDQSANQNFSPTLAGLVFAEDQIGFLAGAMAALVSKSGQVAAVCASDSDPAIKRVGDGFLAGAAYISQDVKAQILYHNDVDLATSFSDPDWAAAQASALVNTGTDILFGVGGETGSNAIVSAVGHGAYAIGADNDAYYALPVAAPHIYVSIIKQIAQGVTQLISLAQSAQNGSSVFPSGNFKGQVGLSPYHEMDQVVPEAIKSRISTLEQALVSGEIQTGVDGSGP